jgi:hypothetical protein
VSIDDTSDDENEVQSEPVVIRSTNEELVNAQNITNKKMKIFSPLSNRWTQAKCRLEIHVYWSKKNRIILLDVSFG